jgi:hypothetical protein
MRSHLTTQLFFERFLKQQKMSVFLQKTNAFSLQTNEAAIAFGSGSGSLPNAFQELEQYFPTGEARSSSAPACFWPVPETRSVLIDLAPEAVRKIVEQDF